MCVIGLMEGDSLRVLGFTALEWWKGVDWMRGAMREDGMERWDGTGLDKWGKGVDCCCQDSEWNQSRGCLSNFNYGLEEAAWV
jgi:hypothetical protein